MPVAALAAAGIGGSIIGAIGSNSAAGKQADAANNAAQLQFEAGNNALNFQKQQYNNSLQLLQPYYSTGVGALDLLRNGLGIPGASPNNFQFPGSAPSPSIANLRGLLGGDSPVDRLGMLRGGSGPQPFQATSAAVPNGGFGFNGTNLLSDGSAAPKPGQSFGFNGVNPVSGLPGTAPTSGGSILPAGQVGNGGMAFNGGPEVVPRAGGDTGSASNVGFGSLLQSYPGGPFVAPNAVTEMNDPGWQFRLKTGLDSLQNSAAARGGLLSGGTAKSLEDFAQNDASNEYGNVYNRALSTYGTNYNTFTNDQTNQFNKLAAIAGLGQTSANQLSTAGLNTGNQVGNTLLNESNQVGGDLLAAGNARGSGFQNIGNSIGNGISSLSNLALLSQILNQGGGTSTGGFV